MDTEVPFELSFSSHIETYPITKLPDYPIDVVINYSSGSAKLYRTLPAETAMNCLPATA
jgi:hypothetical protein